MIILWFHCYHRYLSALAAYGDEDDLFESLQVHTLRMRLETEQQVRQKRLDDLDKERTELRAETADLRSE